MPDRYRMPETRRSMTREVQIGAHEATIVLGFYDDDDSVYVGEMFIKIAKIGSFLNGVISILSEQTSLMLQFGIPLEDIINRWEQHLFDNSEVFVVLAKSILITARDAGCNPRIGYPGPKQSPTGEEDTDNGATTEVRGEPE